jgi:hypothetical protein
MPVNEQGARAAGTDIDAEKIKIGRDRQKAPSVTSAADKYLTFGGVRRGLAAQFTNFNPLIAEIAENGRGVRGEDFWEK